MCQGKRSQKTFKEHLNNAPNGKLLAHVFDLVYQGAEDGTADGLAKTSWDIVQARSSRIVCVHVTELFWDQGRDGDIHETDDENDNLQE